MPFLHINNSATGDQQLVAAPGAGCFIRVLGGGLSSAAAQALVQLKSGASTTIWSTLALNNTNSQNDVAQIGGEVTVDCAVNEALNINCSAANNVRGGIEYVILGKPTLPY